MTNFQVKQDEHNFQVNFTAENSAGNPIDLDGSIPWFYIGDYTESLPTYSGQCIIDTAASGTCHLSLPSSATSSVGTYHGELIIEYASPKQTIKAQELTITVLPSIE